MNRSNQIISRSMRGYVKVLGSANAKITLWSGDELWARVKEQWTHRPDGRWVERIVSTNNGTSYYPSQTNRYVWDNQVLLAVLDHTNGVVVSFMRGVDLSGSLQGAGGVGGVLAVRVGPAVPSGPLANTTHFTCYDGNGNVTALKGVGSWFCKLTHFIKAHIVREGSLVFATGKIEHCSLRWLAQITFATNSTTVMTTTKGYDFVNRLTNMVSASASSSFSSSFDYKYNTANQRTSVTNVDGSYWVYSYDSMGQVTSGRKYWSDGTPVAGQQFDYAFDDIGNRQTTTRDTRQASYSVNSLNQYTSRDVPGFVNVLGTATNTATVSLWSPQSTALFTPTTRKGDYFRGEMPFNNNTGAMWLTITNVAVLSNSASADIVTNIVGNLLLAKNPELFTYDLDGNLTSDGLWTNLWNGENRRITIESRSTLPATAKRKVAWTILADGRWVERIVSTNNGTSYYPSQTNRYVWDNQVLLAVLDHTNGVVVSFMRGVDMSGSIQGAGGVGGVLAVRVGPAVPSGPLANTTHFTCYDGNGNVTALMNAATGEESARYEYAPFAERLRETGPMAKLNPIRFSTQYHDDYTEDDKYVFRDLRDGRWPSRDPIGERGGMNLYGFVGNSPLNKVDHLGLDAAIINHGGYTGHTSFVIINPDGSVKAYHFYAKSHQTGRCCGLGSLLSVCCDKVSVWSETSGSLTNYLQSQQALGGDVKIVAYALGTPLDDQLSLEDLDEQDKADAGIYSLALGVECHKKSWDWFNEYKEGGPEIYPTLLPGQPWPPYWPERWFETRRHRQQSFPQVPAPPTPAPAP